ncbi:unnamed protein product [Symbiodinium natans]|uniref:Amine oxidase domain-containing protein n=1 Tax=Symbiodinium natans TaxID=878477 RepID=A0A812PRK3_9DINO|nr:unnamed protein product [Symbiodinium natans]
MASKSAGVVGIVGGGMAGVTAARALSGKGVAVRLYEKEAALGGRLGAVQLGEQWLGLGTTYVKAKDPLFKAEMAKCEELGLASEWMVGTPHFIAAPGDFSEKPEYKAPTDRWHVGRPNMGSLVELSAKDFEHITRCGEVASVSWEGETWLLNGSDPVSALILALPLAPLRSLLPAGTVEGMLPTDLLEKDFEKARVAAAWVFAAPLELPFRIAFVKDSPISLVLNDSSRATQDGAKVEAWVAQTSTEWAAQCIKDAMPEAEVCAVLLRELSRILGKELPPVQHQKALTWAYGDMDYKLPEGHAWDATKRLALAGDWCYNGRVEGAWLSGHHAAQKVFVYDLSITENTVLYSEAFAFLAFCHLHQVDFIAESGVYKGVSTEIWSLFAKEVAAVDIFLTPEAEERLQRRSNVELHTGDGRQLLPELLSRPGRRAAVFIDGPKGELAIHLALSLVKLPQVAFVAMHDMEPYKRGSVFVSEARMPMATSMSPSEGVLTCQRVAGSLACDLLCANAPEGGQDVAIFESTGRWCRTNPDDHRRTQLWGSVAIQLGVIANFSNHRGLELDDEETDSTSVTSAKEAAKMLLWLDEIESQIQVAPFVRRPRLQESALQAAHEAAQEAAREAAKADGKPGPAERRRLQEELDREAEERLPTQSRDGQGGVDDDAAKAAKMLLWLDEIESQIQVPHDFGGNCWEFWGTESSSHPTVSKAIEL